MTGLPGPGAAEWDRLAVAAGSVFATHTWHSCWWRHFGGSDRPLVVTDDERAPRFIWPLYLSGTALRRLRLMGNGTADRLGPVCAPEDDPRAMEQLLPLLSDALGTRSWDVLLLQDVPADGWSTGLGGREIRRVASPVVRFPDGGWEGYLASRSKNFRDQVRGRERKLRRTCKLTVRLTGPDTLESDLATLFRLHEGRWGAHAAFADARHRPFHEDFARAAQSAGWLRLWVLELDGVAAAALYGFRFGDAEYYYQAGRNPDFDKLSVGFVLLSHALRAATEDGVPHYRLLRGGESYKDRFANADETVHTVAVARSLQGRVAIGLVTRRNAR